MSIDGLAIGVAPDLARNKRRCVRKADGRQRREDEQQMQFVSHDMCRSPARCYASAGAESLENIEGAITSPRHLFMGEILCGRRGLALLYLR